MLKKKQDFKDIPFFISKNPFTNDLNTVNNLPAIRQALKNIILTNYVTTSSLSSQLSNYCLQSNYTALKTQADGLSLLLKLL